MRWTVIERRWHPVDDGALPYALAAMRALWVWPLLHLFAAGLAPGQRDLLTWPAVFALLALSTAIAQIAAFSGRPDGPRALTRIPGRALVAVSGLIAVIATLYLDLGQPLTADLRWLDAPLQDPMRSISLLVVAVWLWWWGVLAGRDTILYDTYAANFATGTAGLGLAALVSFGTGILPFSFLLGPALAFFAVGLVTLAVASLRAARRHERERQDPTFRVSRYWLATIGGVVIAVLGVGLLLVQLLTPDVVRRILAAASPLVDLLAQVFYWLLVAAAWLVFTVLGGLARLMGLRPPEGAQPMEIQPPPDLAAQLRDLETHPVGLAPGAYTALRILAGLVIAGIILLIFALAFRRFRTFFEDDVVEIRDSVLSLDLLKAQLGELLRRRRPSPAPPPFVSVEGDDPTASVRRTYQALLAWAAGRGLARSPGTTPEEYLRLLSGALPDCAAPLAALTAAYVQARYSPGPVPMAAAEEAMLAWERIARITEG